MTKNPVFMFTIWALFLSGPAFAEERTIPVDIDGATVNAPVKVRVKDSTEQSARTAVVEDEDDDKKAAGKVSGTAIAVGAIAAGALAAIGGGGGSGGSGGGSATVHH